MCFVCFRCMDFFSVCVCVDVCVCARVRMYMLFVFKHITDICFCFVTIYF